MVLSTLLLRTDCVQTAAKAAIVFLVLAARLKAAPFQNDSVVMRG
jgi:hypothetical protein